MKYKENKRMNRRKNRRKKRRKKIIKVNTNKCKVIGALVVTLVLVVGIGIIKANSKEEIACAKERSKVLEGATITDLALNSSNEIKKGPSKSYGKVVYLTIDDGPSEYTDKIIKILNKNNVKATFFMIENNMKAFPNQVKNIVESGNVAGFHSITHDVNKLYKTNTSAKEEFDVNQKTFKAITGKTSNLIRLPFGSKPYTPRDSYNALVGSGYKLWDWNLDTEDWRATTSQIINNVRQYSKNKDTVVLLMHERVQSVAALDDMIKNLKNDGFEFVTIKESEQEKNFWLGNLTNEAK
ncbi:MAG: polysaccharide deacetylase family protein [Terrisporobacter sp.]